MKIALTSESTIDLSQELLDKFQIQTVPFMVSLGDELLRDEQGVSQKIYDFVAKTKVLPKTSAVNQNDYTEFFNGIFNQGFDAIIHIALSSSISSACENAKAVAKTMKNVYVVDSKHLSTGVACLAIFARKLIDIGKNEPAEIAALTQEKASQIQTGFVIENLHYLYKGGRCSAIAMFGANLLRIKPQIAMIDGKLKMVRKFMGNLYKVTDKYCDELLKSYPNANKEYVFITHSSEMPEIVENLRAKLQNFGFKNIYETNAGGTISSHCGPNCIGILFDGGKK